MRGNIFLGLGLLALLLGACNEQIERNASESTYIRSESRTNFRTIAPAAYLGDDWAQSTSSGVRGIWSDPSGERALIVLRGPGVPALWLNRERSQVAVSLELEHVPQHVNVLDDVAYAVVDGQMLSRELPDGEWEVLFGSDSNGEAAEVLAVGGHSKSEALWLLSASRPPAQTSAGDPDMTPGVNAPLTKDGVLQSAAEDKAELSLQIFMLKGDGLEAVDLPVTATSDSDTQLAVLADGSAVVAVNGNVYGVGAGLPVAQLHSSERRVLLAADPVDPRVWIYVRPEGASSGTGRELSQPEAGRVITLLVDGRERFESGAGDVPFSQFAGDWHNRRALLARDSVGVLSVNMETQTVSWPLRHGGDTPLYLLGGGQQLWALLPDGIAAISAEKLHKLAPMLAAGQVLPREDVARLKPVVEALGWKFADVQVSPLLGYTGGLTLFNTADPDSEVAELDWNPKLGHVSRLLIVRSPGETDMDLAAGGEPLTELLTAMGWPNATAVTSVSGEQLWQLEPGNGAHGPGEFRVWLTEDSVLLSLDPATAPLPEGLLALEEAQRLALEEVKRRSAEAVVDGEPLVESGWVGADGARLLPEGGDNARPAYLVEATTSAPECRVYRVLLSAAEGDVLHVDERACSPLLGSV